MSTTPDYPEPPRRVLVDEELVLAAIRELRATTDDTDVLVLADRLEQELELPTAR